MTVAHLWALRGRQKLLLAAFAFTTIAAMPASAQTQVWDSMRANSFAPTVSAAQEQCLRSYLSEAECAEFARKLAAGEYETVRVPDGTSYSRMNFAIDGVPSSQGRTVKQLGSETQARRVRLSSGRVLDWYTGFQGACNNVGLDPRQPPVEHTPQCRWVPFSDAHTIGTHIHADGTVHYNCCCAQHPVYTPGYSGYVPNTLQSTGGARICE